MTSTSKPLRIVVTPFSGDPDLLDFFTEQVKACISYSKWNNEQALIFLKSKLSDQALKFYISSTACKKATSPEDLFSIFRKHFKSESSNSIALKYNNIKILPSESVRNFATRLDNIVRKHFPLLPDSSIEQILMSKFTELIPDHLKIHILTQNIDSFEKMVEAASSYQEILDSVQAPAHTVATLPPSYSTLHSIDNESTDPTSHNDSSVDESEPSSKTHSTNPSDSSCNTQTRYSTDRNKRNIHFIKHSYKRIICQWCRRPGHSANHCFKLKDILDSKPNQRSRQKHHTSPKNTTHSSNSSRSSTKNSTSRRNDTNKHPRKP